MRALLLGVVLAAAGCGTSHHTAKQQAPKPIGDTEVQFGWIRSISPAAHGSYLIRFDLGLRLAGKTAAAACIDNDGCPKGTTGFPDDVYDRDLHYLLTLRLAPHARVTMVGDRGTTLRPVVSPAQLYAIVHGRNPWHIQVMDPSLRDFAWVAEIHSDSDYDHVTRLEQAYHP